MPFIESRFAAKLHSGGAHKVRMPIQRQCSCKNEEPQCRTGESECIFFDAVSFRLWKRLPIWRESDSWRFALMRIITNGRGVAGEILEISWSSSVNVGVDHMDWRHIYLFYSTDVSL